MKIFKLKTKKYFLKKAGFTLIELLVSMVIVSIMLFISVDTTVKLIRQSELSDLRSEVDRGVNYAVETMKRNIIQANLNGINTCPGSCIIVNGTRSFKMVTDSAANTSRIVQTDTGPTPQCPVTTPCDLTGTSIFVKNLEFTFTEQFVEINLEIYDTNQLLYTQARPFSIVTGALIRN